MPQETNSVALIFILMGALFNFGRVFLAQQLLRLYSWLNRKPSHERLQAAMQFYFVLLGMIFTVVGILGVLGIIKL